MTYFAASTTCTNCGRPKSQHKQYRDAKPPHCPPPVAPEGEPVAEALEHRDLQWRRALLMDEPWGAFDVLAKLADAADHLLKDHSCDTHGWEEFGRARDQARRIVAGWPDALRSRVAPRDGDAAFARGFGHAIARVRAGLYRDVVMPLDVFKECDKMLTELLGEQASSPASPSTPASSEVRDAAQTASAATAETTELAGTQPESAASDRERERELVALLAELNRRGLPHQISTCGPDLYCATVGVRGSGVVPFSSAFAALHAAAAEHDARKGTTP